MKVINDGEVTALAAVQKIKAGNVMGISMGSSEGAGVSVASVLSKKTVKKQRCFPWFSHFSCDLMSESHIKSQPRLRAKTLNHTHNTHNQDKVGYPVFRSFGRLTLFFFSPRIRQCRWQFDGLDQRVVLLPH